MFLVCCECVTNHHTCVLVFGGEVEKQRGAHANAEWKLTQVGKAAWRTWCRRLQSPRRYTRVRLCGERRTSMGRGEGRTEVPHSSACTHARTRRLMTLSAPPPCFKPTPAASSSTAGTTFPAGGKEEGHTTASPIVELTPLRLFSRCDACVSTNAAQTLLLVLLRRGDSLFPFFFFFPCRLIMKREV